MTLRLCLDLNIWCAALLAEKKNRRGTACQTLVTIVRKRECNWGRVELVISWGMLNRLEKVLVKDLQVSTLTAQMYLKSIEDYTLRLPQLTLGGTGIIPLHDSERGQSPLTVPLARHWYGTSCQCLLRRPGRDASVMRPLHVLETAVAGKAQILVTANFKDFIDKNVEIVTENRHGIYRSADCKCHIVHPYLMAHWLNTLAVCPD